MCNHDNRLLFSSNSHIKVLFCWRVLEKSTFLHITKKPTKVTEYRGMISNLTDARWRSPSYHHWEVGTDKNWPGHQKNLTSPCKVCLWSRLSITFKFCFVFFFWDVKILSNFLTVTVQILQPYFKSRYFVNFIELWFVFE